MSDKYNRNRLLRQLPGYTLIRAFSMGRVPPASRAARKKGGFGMDMHSMICFLGASILLTLAPGPDNIFVVTQGVSRGRKAAALTLLKR